jgi:cyclase
MVEVVKQAAGTLSIPFTVGGGIGSVEDMFRLLRAGADKTSINTAALERPRLIEEGARRFGSQCMVVAIDARYHPDKRDWEVFSHGGRKPTGRKAVERGRSSLPAWIGTAKNPVSIWN